MFATPQEYHICFIILNNPFTPGHPKSMTSLNLQNLLGQCNFGAAGLPCWPCWYVIFVLLYQTIPTPSLNLDTRAFYFLYLNNKIIPLLTAAFCSGLDILSPRVGILKALRPQEYRESWYARFTFHASLITGANTLNGDRCQGTYRDTGSQQLWHMALIQ